METVLAAVASLFLGLLIGRSTARTSRRDDTAWRLGEIERRLRLVTDHLGVADVEPALPEVREQLALGNKIEAIKAYREATGADLKTAKDAVEAMIAGR